MVAIPTIDKDPTLEALDAVYAAKPAKLSNALGMGGLSSTCNRKIWYGFRWYVNASVSFKTNLIFDSGHRAEAAVAKYLSEVVEIHTIDPNTNYQYGFIDMDGHFKGFMDGVILGLKQAPNTWHVWDNKETNEKKYNNFLKIKSEVGDKATLETWNFGYYIQAQLYMLYAELDRHYMTVTTNGVRQITSCRTEFNKPFAEAQRDRAQRIITLRTPPSRIGKPEHFECGWCEYKAVCHEGAAPAMNCRTCKFSRPDKEGKWLCEKHGHTMDKEMQSKGCQQWERVNG